ncbi:hypothetical protein BU26DRAFT_558409 [Trematosphaeria pertusa]|uniref:Uncharacterized protein n=1 Tax=Trematosphaeria pertusa TaxID=390896 RepID=A0A6A6J3K5_9PLEO|nr:uncharacterized protein BU26DRAFT_558409 [Trematosphaeria pertusa]KAF2256981.1 hypothetical protein BU26DRAFT_558409 [Trematosphaeria pertusa]
MALRLPVDQAILTQSPLRPQNYIYHLQQLGPNPGDAKRSGPYYPESQLRAACEHILRLRYAHLPQNVIRNFITNQTLNDVAEPENKLGEPSNSSISYEIFMEANFDVADAIRKLAPDEKLTLWLVWYKHAQAPYEKFEKGLPRLFEVFGQADNTVSDSVYLDEEKAHAAARELLQGSRHI